MLLEPQFGRQSASWGSAGPHDAFMKGKAMRWTPRGWAHWGITLALAFGIFNCSGDNNPKPLTGTWTGTLQDSLAGRGTVVLNISQANQQLSGTWQSTFPDPRNNNGGRPCTCTLRIITTGLPGRPSQEQKGLAERVLMASQRLSHPW